MIVQRITVPVCPTCKRSTGCNCSGTFLLPGPAVVEEPCDRCGKMNHRDDLQPYSGVANGASEHGRYCHDCLREFRMEE